MASTAFVLPAVELRDTRVTRTAVVRSSASALCRGGTPHRS
jgi:hypothetical protein